MNKTIFQKLRERIDKRKFDRIQTGDGRTMMGMILTKSDWKKYQKAVPKIVLSGYSDKIIMWFRGYPLKQKDD